MATCRLSMVSISKSKIIGGTEGQIHIGSRDVTRVDPAERGVAMVFQTYALYPHMTVEENMGFGLKMNGVSKEEIKKKTNRDVFYDASGHIPARDRFLIGEVG